MIAPYLFVPLKMDALCLSDGGAVLDAYEAFDHLPRVDAEGDHNAASPYVSTTIDSTAFNDHNLFLPAGVHLHWALPPALSRGRAQEGSADVEFVAAPNRWLVVRSISNDEKSWTVSAVNSASESAGGETGMWMIESDFITTDQTGEGRFDSHFVTYPVPSVVDGVPNKNLRPDRFLGRVSTLSAAGFIEQTADNYLPSIAPKLTAVGYGEPAFAAFYPNCIGVFGMHDPHPLHPQNTRYDLFGWYSDAATDDPFLAAVRKFAATPNSDLRKLANHYAVDAKRPFIPEDSSNQPLQPDDFAFAFFKSLEEETQWQLDPAEFTLDSAAKTIRAANAPVTGIICYSRLSLKGNHSFGALPKMTLPVGIGKTGSEALAAVLADQIASPAQASQLEDLLEFLSLSKDLAGSKLDAAARFSQARHAEGFRPTPGECIWTVRPANAASGPDTSVTLPGDLAQSLNLLNSLQGDYDQRTFKIESRQQNLFSAWVRFMQLSYPDNPEFLLNFEDDRMIAPSANLIRLHEMAALQAAQAARGTVNISIDVQGNWTAGIPSGPGQPSMSSAVKLKAQLDLMQAGLVALNKDRDANGEGPLLLSRSDGPRFYDPAEPVVLFFGDSRFRPSARYEQAPAHAHIKGLSLFQSGRVSAAAAAELVAQLDHIRTLTDNGFKEAKDTDTEEQRRPWNPFLLEWEALVATNPLAKPIGPMNNRGLGAFRPQYISGNPGRRQSLLGLTPPPDEKAEISALFRPIRGRTVLSSHPLIQLNELLAGFAADPPDPAGSSSTQAAGRMQQINSLLSQVTKTLSTDFHCLAQSLGGFNRALLMQRAAFQLPIGDPISMADPKAGGFDAYPQFTSQVRTALRGAGSLDSPEPNYGFYPIQGGSVFLQRLRIVDTFGQVLEWDNPELIRSTTLGGGRNHHIVLSPRITQPARLNFRWLSALNDAVESNDHPASTPVCGWIIPNHIDQSFDVYDTEGAIQGIVDSSGRFRMPPGQVTGPVRAEDIANPHLSALVRFLAGDSGRLQTFTANLNKALDQIDPESFAQHRARAILVGRPLALVRARVDLELRGIPASDQSWIDLRNRLAYPNRGPNTRDFQTVRFPIRIGDHNCFNDGVATYWLEQGPDLPDPIFAFDPTLDKNILWHSIQDPGMILSLLIDPRAPVTASCGVLPSKSITVPADQFAAALRNMEISFLISPILTEPDKTLLPLPTDPDLTWTWLQRDGSSWTTIPETPLLFLQTILAAFPERGEEIWNKLIANQWIKPVDDHPELAILLRQPAAGQVPLDGFDTAAITRLIGASTRAIAPVEIHGRFGPSIEIREGYLRLNQDFTA